MHGEVEVLSIRIVIGLLATLRKLTDDRPFFAEFNTRIKTVLSVKWPIDPRYN